jgi:acyl-[acyl-carrier-protein]-phospholipid O-acyltransferase/long-chain-fatty-acid--[acyl-carrier-protein] ligase
MFAACLAIMAPLGQVLASHADLMAPVAETGQLARADVAAAAGLAALVLLVPRRLITEVVRVASWFVYRIRVYGRENVPRSGGVLLVSNHISWLDGPLLMLLTGRPIRVLVHAGNFRSRLARWWAEQWGAILVDNGPHAIARALRVARQALKDGEAVCIFPEAGISRSGQVMAFRPGLMRILQGHSAPVIPVYIDELWGSIFTFAGGRFFWTWPRHWRQRISVHYGRPLDTIESVYQVRQAVQQLGAEAVNKRARKFMSLPRAMVRMFKKRLFTSKFADSSGTDASGGSCLMRSLILRRLLLRHVLEADEKYVGLLLPPSVGALLSNAALALDGRVAINLNYSTASDELSVCIKAAGIRHVLTSRQVISKLGLELDVPVVYLEDFKEKVRLSDKLTAAAAAYLLPSWLLIRVLGLHRRTGDEIATIIFTSGSTGIPKGVVLSYDNIASNVEAIDQVIRPTKQDVVIGILPFFHSFGYTVTLWTPLALNVKCIYHYSPIDGKRIGQLAEKHGATILLATPTFLRNYVQRCTAAQFRTLDVVVAGAERLPSGLCDSFEARFGVRPVEGYGCTELSPLGAVNVPPSRAASVVQRDNKEGTVGRPVPGVAAKIVNPDTGQELGPHQEGMLWMKGPNVMQGYLNQPDKTAEVIKDGWYVTGDIAQIDEEGFITITGRESRFSKIGGEMVPHVKIEETLSELIGDDKEEEPKVAVTAVPDERKGERLVVLHTKIDKTPEQLREALSHRGLPNLYLPATECFVEVDQLPLLGSGKLDLKRIKELAIERFGV